MTFNLPEHLQTLRLELREPVIADARVLFESYTQDIDVTRFMVWRPHTDITQTAAFVEECIRDWAAGLRRPYVLALRGEAERPIGMLDARLRGHSIAIGYVLTRQCWGKGLMPEAISAFCETALSEQSIYRIQATCDVDNIASARTLEKSGFTREGRLGRFTMHPNISAEPRPCFIYARCR
jgi:[ribosomal protein S5]-alanine N-acetyltransferase